MALGVHPVRRGDAGVQAGVVAAPRAARGSRGSSGCAGRGWALVPIASIVGVIFAIRYVSGTATGLT